MKPLLLTIALLFSTSAWAGKPNEVCSMFVYDSTSLDTAEFIITKSCDSGLVAKIHSDIARKIIPRVCRFDRQIVKLHKAAPSKNINSNNMINEKEEVWACVVK